MRILPINIDSDNKQTALCAAVGDFGTPADIGQFALGDKEEFEIYFFGANELGEWFGAPETRIEVGLGEIAIPESGTFDLKITSAQGPQVLSDIDIAISAQELEDKLNALPNVSAAGGLDVQGTNPFIITARTADANFEIEAKVIDLNPISGALIQSQEVDGRQVITLSIRTALCAYSDDFVFAEDGEVYRGSLSLLTRELRAALGDSEQKRFAFEISIIKPDGSRTTAYQTRINVINKLIDDAAFGAVALPIFLTKAQADASYAPISAISEVATLRDDLSELSDDFSESKSSVESELSELQSRKANIGEHLFNSGKIVGDISFPNFPFSICITYELDNFSTSASQVLFQAVAANGQRIVLFTSTTNKLVLDISSSSATTRRYITLSDSLLGKHNLIWVARSLTNANNPDWVLYLDGIEVETIVSNTNYTTSDVSGNRPYAVNTTADALVGSAASTNPISIYDLKLFNFDMSADDALYTVADYAAGKQPSLLLKQGTLSTTDPTMGASTGTGWNITTAPSSTVTNGDWRAGQYVSYLRNRTSDLPDGASYAVDIACSDWLGARSVNTLFYNYAVSIADFQGKTNWYRISGWVRKNTASSGTGPMDSIVVGTQYDTILQLKSADFEQGVWTKIDKIISFTEDRSWGGNLAVIGLSACGQSYTDYAWSLADIKVEVLGEVLELADFRSGYQIKDLSGNGNHATIFGDVISRKNEDPTSMQVEYAWGSGVSTGAYIMGDTVTLPANAEIEVLAKSSASATLSLGTSSSATTTFANAASVGTTAKSIAKFYTADAAQKLFATPSVAGLTINLTLKITSLK